MPLREELESSGNWLFIRRSWLPVLLYPFAIAVMYFYNDRTFSKVTDESYGAICLLVSFLGLLVRALTVGYTPKGTSGRNTTSGQIAETLNQTGMYSMVRHPLYLGNYLMWLGLFLFVGLWWFAVICSLLYWLYYERIMIAEEEFLRRKYGSSYETWAAHTPAFLPRFSSFRAPNLTFSMRNVLKREYNGVFAVAISFAVMNALAYYFVTGEVKIDNFWAAVFIVCFLAFIILRTLKKTTRVLEVEGR
ncbi:isoprenylcysteine carboxylmethyltransferase family protein [Pedobacter sp. SYSU D00535]|uniref:methyltransferase family protein n=1 Tax=Pedobacter sp. SYSU D00535 TaxID=2810308 RepID=UPI001A96556E|nr:isoprenylcysteine carboxylmethyltransferase family protein [Pedobacter sp. SYSU D00535]